MNRWISSEENPQAIEIQSKSTSLTVPNDMTNEAKYCILEDFESGLSPVRYMLVEVSDQKSKNCAFHTNILPCYVDISNYQWSPDLLWRGFFRDRSQVHLEGAELI